MTTDSARGALRELLTACFALTKNALVFDDKNAALLRACERTASAANTLRQHGDGMAALRLLEEGLYINDQLARFDASAYDQGEYLSTVWRSVGVGEIAAMAETSRDDWLELTRELMRCIRGQSDAVRAEGSRTLAIASVADVSREHQAEGGIQARAARAFAVATLALEDALADLHGGHAIRVVELKRPLLELVDAAPRCRELLLALALDRDGECRLARHLANTATLTICMADQLGLDRELCASLAVQACLHDLGRATGNGGASAQVEVRELEHATESVCALLRATEAPRAAPGRVVVANEVRLWANSDPATGDYPYPPCGAARLIAVASAFDLLTTAGPRRAALLPDQALRVLMAEAGRRYDDAAVRVLADLVGVFPVGSLVELNTGELAVPLRASSNEDGWARPIVKIVREPAGAVCDGAIVDLAEEHEHRRQVVGCVAPEPQGITPAAFLIG